MERLHSLLESSTTPYLTAILLGLLTALSPCPLATNIAAIGYIGKQIESRRVVFINGLLYTLGRVLAYTLLGILLITLIKSGVSTFGVQSFIATYGEAILGPSLLIIGAVMLLGDKLKFPSFGFSKKGENLAKPNGAGALYLGILFALAFCPTSGLFYFGMLIPMSATAATGYLMPAIFAIATAIPVLIVAWILAFSANRIGAVYGKMKILQKWLNAIAAILFIGIGIFYCITIYI
ncbi:MAG: aromatic aminobenezylarsenical efflux permease ArsG family transporter [Paludibacteraceae bacterium]